MFTGLESPTHLIIVLVIVLLFFGAKHAPELARSLGEGVREFRRARQDEDEEDALEVPGDREERSDLR